MPGAIDSPHYDRALATAMLLLTVLDTAGDTPTPLLLSKFTFLILEAISEARPLPPGFAEPSAN
jgi:hypothetical protein